MPECDVLADSRVVGGDPFAKHRAILVGPVMAPIKHRYAVAAPLLTAFQARTSKSQKVIRAVLQFSEVDLPFLVCPVHCFEGILVVSVDAMEDLLVICF